jgi:hypothetical protein
MGDLHECLWRGIIFYVAARDHFSEIVVLVDTQSGTGLLSAPKQALPAQYSGIAVVLALLLLFGLEQGLNYLHTLKFKEVQPHDLPPISYEAGKEVVVEEITNPNPNLVHDDTLELLSASAADAESPEFVEEIRTSITKFSPHRAEDGTSGVYFMKNQYDRRIGVFKPADEESRHLEGVEGSEIKPGCTVGEGYLKEVAASLLDKDGFHGVPRTVVAQFAHDVFDNCGVPSAKVGSLQEFVPSKCTSEDMGYSKFSTRDVHKIGLLDCRILNQDRHLGNILVTEEEGAHGLVPIDHALSMPSTIAGGSFEWLQFPQCKQPFDTETVNFVCNIDVDRDVNMLRKRLPELKEDCIETMKLCTIFLKKAVEKRFTLFEIGCMMSRYADIDEACVLEKMYIRVKDRIAREETPYWCVVNEEIDRVLARKGDM